MIINDCSCSLYTKFPLQDAFLKAQRIAEMPLIKTVVLALQVAISVQKLALVNLGGSNVILTEGCYELTSQPHQVEKEV